MASLQLLYQDSHYVAINKPAGLLVHRSELDPQETRFAVQLLRDQLGQWVYPVHRLDKPTSGVLLFALSPAAASRLSTAFSHGAVDKRYLAVVRGYMPEAGRIDYPLREKTDGVGGQAKTAQPAVTDYRCLATAELPYAVGRYDTLRCSLVEALPRSGRQHQIRRHMKHIAHPLIGDTTHGDGKVNRCFRDRLGCHRLLLAATVLRFDHPYAHRPVTITAPLDEPFRRVAGQLGWEGAVPSEVAGDVAWAEG